MDAFKSSGVRIELSNSTLTLSLAKLTIAEYTPS